MTAMGYNGVGFADIGELVLVGPGPEEEVGCARQGRHPAGTVEHPHGDTPS